MGTETDDAAVTVAGEASWQDRALERSLAAAREKAMKRSHRFIDSAMEILQETGRTDFTVQELVERSKTSLRSFYQYFASKDELLLALLEETIADSAAKWRKEAEGLPSLDALRMVMMNLYGGSDTSAWGKLSHALTAYHIGLADSTRDAYARAFSPLARLVHELIVQGADNGVIRTDIPVATLTPIVIRTLIGGAIMDSLSAAQVESAPSLDALWQFFAAALGDRG